MSFYLDLQEAIYDVRQRYPEHLDFSRNPIKAIEQLQADYKEDDDANHLLQVLVCFCCDMPEEETGPAYEILIQTHGYVGLGRRYWARVRWYGKAFDSIICSLYRAELLNTETLEWLNRVSIPEGFVGFFTETLQKLEPFLTLDMLKSVIGNCYKEPNRVSCFVEIITCLAHFINKRDVEWLAARFDTELVTLSEIFLCLVQNELVKKAMTAAIVERHVNFSKVMKGLFKWLNMQKLPPNTSLTFKLLSQGLSIRVPNPGALLTDTLLADCLAIIASNYSVNMVVGLEHLANNKLLTPENRSLLIEHPRLISCPIPNEGNWYRHWDEDWDSPGLLLKFAENASKNSIYLDQELLQCLARWSNESDELIDGIIISVNLIKKRYSELNAIASLKKLLSVDLKTGQLLFTKYRYYYFQYDVANESDFNRLLEMASAVSVMNRANHNHLEIAIILSRCDLAPPRNLQQLQIVSERPQGTENAILQLLWMMQSDDLTFGYKRIPLNQSMFNYVLTLAPLLACMDMVSWTNFQDDVNKDFYMRAMLEIKRWMDAQTGIVPTIELLDQLAKQKEIIEQRLERFIQKELSVAQQAVLALEELHEQQQRFRSLPIEILNDLYVLHPEAIALEEVPFMLAELEEQLPLPLMVVNSFILRESEVNVLAVKVSKCKAALFGSVHDHVEVHRGLEYLKKN